MDAFAGFMEHQELRLVVVQQIVLHKLRFQSIVYRLQPSLRTPQKPL
jgi:hypothetical protein